MKSLLVVIVTFVSLIGTAFGAERLVSVNLTTAAPILIVPDLNRTSLRVAEDGSVINIRQRPRLDTRIKSASSKLFLGVDFEGIVIMETSATAPPSTNSGSGAGLVVGYGLTPRWALYANLSGGHVQDPDSRQIFGLGHFDVGTRVHFRTGPHVVVPFAQVGLARRAGYMTLDTSTGSQDFKAAPARRTSKEPARAWPSVAASMRMSRPRSRFLVGSHGLSEISAATRSMVSPSPGCRRTLRARACTWA
jgi:hypothetical protein